MGSGLVRGLLAITVLAGCAGLPIGVKDPELHLDRVVVRGMGLSGGTMDLIVSVYNPNPFDLAGTRLQLGFDVEDSHVGDLTYDNDFAVQKGDTTSLSLPLQFTWNGLAAAARTAFGTGELPYTLRGQLMLQSPIGGHTVPFTHEGRVPLTRAAGVVLPRAGR
jgi:LEA14-like dessication related protein